MCGTNYHQVIMYFKCGGCGNTISSNEVKTKIKEVSSGVFNGTKHCPNCDAQILDAEYFWDKLLTRKYHPPKIYSCYVLMVMMAIITLFSCTHAPKSYMIVLTDRPENLETPLKYFKEDFTPNDHFFVRWHTQNVPTTVDTDTFKLRVLGDVKKSIAISLADIKKLPRFTINAVCVCAGNARAFSKPSVAGIQWSNGGMGNAKWVGVKLKDMLSLTGNIDSTSVLSFNGLDEPLASAPDYVKTMKYKDLDNAMIAYEMNGKSLSISQGFPLRLVVAGWYATYWVKMLSEITVYTKTKIPAFYWMDKGYLMPKDKEKADSLSKETKPISKIAIRSIFVSPEPETIIEKNKSCEIEGLAFDSGEGIDKVEISTDGKEWKNTRLDKSLGNFSWRRWKYNFIATDSNYTFMVRATNKVGETQPLTQEWNRSGYARNAIETLTLRTYNIKDLIVQKCTACHSLKYLEMQPDLKRENWQKILKKMDLFGGGTDSIEKEQIIKYKKNMK